MNQADEAAIVDTASGEVTRLRMDDSRNEGAYPYGAAISPDGTTAYVTNESSGKVKVIDLDAEEGPVVEDTIEGLGGPQPADDTNSHPEGVVFDPAGQRAYVAVTNRDHIAVIDTETREVERRVSVGRREGVGTAPVSLAVSPDGRTLYSADSGEDAIAVIALPEPEVATPEGESLTAPPQNPSAGGDPSSGEDGAPESGGEGSGGLEDDESPEGGEDTGDESPSGEGEGSSGEDPAQPLDPAAALGAAGQQLLRFAGVGSAQTTPARAGGPVASRSVASIALYRKAHRAALKRYRAGLEKASSRAERRAIRRRYRQTLGRLRGAHLFGTPTDACSGPSAAQDALYARAVLSALARRDRRSARGGAAAADARIRFLAEVAIIQAALPRLLPCAAGAFGEGGSNGSGDGNSRGGDGGSGGRSGGGDVGPHNGSGGSDGGGGSSTRRDFELIGRIPTAAYTTDVDVSADGRTLVWLAGKGLGAGPNPAYESSAEPEGFGDDTGGGSPETSAEGAGSSYVLDLLLGRAGVLDVPSDSELAALTRRADDHVRPANSVDSPPPGSPIPAPGTGPSDKIKHVFYIVRENRTYDQVFGKEPEGDGEASLELFGDNVPEGEEPGPTEGITPNAHAIARRFGLLDHTYANSEVSVDGHIITGGAYAIDYVQKATAANYGGRSRVFDFGVFPITFPPNFFLFDRAADGEDGVSFRNYGEQGNGSSPLSTPKTDGEIAQRPGYDEVLANTDGQSPGNVQIGCVGPRPPVPGGAVAAGTCTHDAGDLGEDTPLDASDDTHGPNGVPDGFDPNLPTTGQSRFNIFKEQFVAQDRAGTVPQFNYLILPNNHTNGTQQGSYTPQALIAENDLALGQFVDLISHSSIWEESAIFVVEDDSQDGADHVDAHRMPAFVISPFGKEGETITTRFDQYSAVRTIGLILGFEPLSLNDGLARPMYEAFSSEADPEGTRYDAIMPQQDLEEVNGAGAADARLSEALPFDQLDLTPQALSDRVLWKSAFGADSVPPRPGPNASPEERARASGAMEVYRHGRDVEEWLEENAGEEEEEEEGEPFMGAFP